MDSFYLFTFEVPLCEKDSFYNITYSWLGIDGIRNLLLMCHCGKLTLSSFANLVKFGVVSRHRFWVPPFNRRQKVCCCFSLDSVRQILILLSSNFKEEEKKGGGKNKRGWPPM